MEHTARVQCDIPYEKFITETEERIAYQIAYILYVDTRKEMEDNIKSLDDDAIVFLCENNYDVGNYLIAKNRLPHTSVTRETIVNYDFSKTKLLFIGDVGVDDSSEIDASVVGAIQKYASAGGKIMSFNSGVIVLSACFPDFKFRHGVTTTMKEIKVQATGPQDLVDLVEKYNGKFMRREGVRRYTPPSSFDVLIEEVAPGKNPIAVKGQLNGASIVHMTEFTGEIDELRSHHKAKSMLEEVIKNAQRPDTVSCWRATKNCHQYNSFYLALALQPFYEAFFSILSQELSN
eukprot:TRINITY_DN2142_c0_g1_i1.p1 TRINITY_DN2142_c0_g1~~TRINITY_DN2142_c0_g1_i1.p1  ORF type:complete len:290 (+),score=53.93 TRINITY_DN2142_c0_g1_i1:258-1127(+)